jgi:hypothetical protein
MQELTIEDQKIWVKGLMIDCPMGKALDTCPAKEVRAIPLRDRLKLVDEMVDEQLSQIIAHHKRCLYEREIPLRRNI